MEVSVNTTILKKTATQISGTKGGISTAADTLRSAADVLATQDDSYAHVAAALRNYGRSIDCLAVGAGKLGSAAATIAGLYDTADGNLSAENREGASKSTSDAASGLGGGFNSTIAAVSFSAVSGAVAGSVSAGKLVTDTKNDSKAVMDFDKGQVYAKGEIGGSLTAVQLKAEGRAGLASGSAEVNVGKVGASGAVKFALMDKGQVDPSFSVKAKAEAIGAEGKVSGKIGTDEFNAHSEAKGYVGYAAAEAGLKVDKEGAKVEAGAEAYAVKGEIKGGYTLFGIKIDASIEGKAGGAGVGTMAEVGATKAEGYIGAGLGVGLGFKISIDWSDFKWPWEQ